MREIIAVNLNVKGAQIMIQRCPTRNRSDIDRDTFDIGIRQLKGKDRITVEESTATLNSCRERAHRRTRNRIALIQPRKGGRPALGLLYIGAYLLDNNYEVRVF